VTPTRTRGRLRPAARAVALAALAAMVVPGCNEAPVEDAARPKARAEARARFDLYGDPLPEGVIARIGTLRLWHPGRVQAVAFSPDGSVIASGCDSNALRIWDARDGRAVFQKDLGWHSVSSVTFSRSGRMLALASSGREALVYDTSTWSESLRLRTPGITCAGLSPEGDVLACGFYDGTIRLFGAATGREVAGLGGHAKGITCLAFSPDGTRLASSSWGGPVIVWEVPVNRPAKKLEVLQSGARAVAFSPDGGVLATAHGWQVSFNDPRTGRARRRPVFFRKYDDTVSVDFSRDGRMLAVGTQAGPWLHRLDRDEHAVLLGTSTGNPAPHRVAFSPDGRTLASANGWGMIRLWDVGKREERPVLGRRSHSFKKVAFTPDCRSVMSITNDGVFRVSDARTGRTRVELPEKGSRVGVTSFSADGNMLVLGDAGCKDEPGRLYLLDRSTGRRIGLGAKVRYPLSRPTVFSPDGKMLAVARGEGRVQLWDFTSGGRTVALQAPERSVHGLVLSCDGGLLATLYYGRCRVWNTETGKESFMAQGHDGTVCAAFSSDGKTLVFGTVDGEVSLWDVPSGDLLRRMRPGLDGLSAVDLSADGRRLVVGSYGGCLRLLDTASGAVSPRIRAPWGHHSSLDLSPDGRLLATGGAVVLIWDLARLKELEPAE
jgi:WD40 repeat protein